MIFTNSPLVSHTNLSPNYSVRTGKIDTITPHIIVGHASLISLGQRFAIKSVQASSNYGVDDKGNVGMFVEAREMVSLNCFGKQIKILSVKLISRTYPFTGGLRQSHVPGITYMLALAKWLPK